jgi:N-ethylmaleimide reductase
MSQESLRPGESPVAPSEIPCEECKVFTVNAKGEGALTPVSAPKAFSLEEIRATVADYATAARNAMAAGFDGVEVHAANGYLIHQFLASNTNRGGDA